MPRSKTPPPKSPAGKAPPAKPTRFNPEIAERICVRIAEGRSVRSACSGDGFPAWRTFMRWLASEGEQFDALRQQYTRARECRADARFESLDRVIYELKLGKIDAQAARVMMDAIKWQTGKENAKRYGESVTVKGDKDAPLEVRSQRDLTDEELAAIAAGGLRGVG